MIKKNWLVEGLAETLKENEDLRSVTLSGMAGKEKAVLSKVYDAVKNFLETRKEFFIKHENELRKFSHDALVSSIMKRLFGKEVKNMQSPLYVVVSDAVSHFMTDLKSPMKEDKIPGGKGDGKPDEDFDPKELKKGIEHEKEHTDDPQKAKEIAKDHLSENPKYYSDLKKAKIENKQIKEVDGDRRQADRRKSPDIKSLISSSSRESPIRFVSQNGIFAVYKSPQGFSVQTFKMSPGIQHNFSSEEEVEQYITQSKATLLGA